MCGIVGIFSFDDDPIIDRAKLLQMAAAITHRGPDDSGSWIADSIGLAHQRLSIVDRASGRQPMANRGESVVIIYNGEVFNYRSLRDQLRERGVTFVTESDTEVVLHAYDVFGEDCVDHLNGQFAFAIWDARRHTLFLARDRLGEKPIHYTVQGGVFSFASEAKALLTDRPAPTFCELAVAESLLCNALLDGRTMFTGILELAAGHTLTVSRNGVGRPHRYWDLPLPSAARPVERIDEERLGAELDELLHDAVKQRLMSEVPLACFLSGGIDSSLIAYWASLHRDWPLDTFAIEFARQLDKGDTTHACALASALGTRHTVIRAQESEYYDVIGDVAFFLERPFEVSAPTLYLLYRAVREQATVVLTGEGSDELTAGYYGTPGLGLAKAFEQHDPTAVPWVAFRPEIEDLLAPDFLRETSAKESVRTSIATCLHGREAATPAEKALHLFQKIFLCELVRTHDRLGMAWSIESRAPFLDHRLVDLLARLPLDLKVRGGTDKYVLRKSAERMLGRVGMGSDIAWRAKKPLPAPRGESLRRQLAEVSSLVLAAGSHSRRFFDEKKLRHFLGREGEFSSLSPLVLYRVSFTLLGLESFLRAFARV